MMVADGLVPIWHQDIYNHYDDVTRSVYIKSAHVLSSVTGFESGRDDGNLFVSLISGFLFSRQ